MYKILIVEDLETLQILYTDELTEEGYEVIICNDGIEAMDMLEQEKPDIIVLDIGLGECNGLDLLHAVRRSSGSVPIILITAYPEFKFNANIIDADAFLVKSSNLEELKMKIEMFLKSTHKLSRQQVDKMIAGDLIG